MPNIHHELVIGASAVSVYSAITTQEGLSAWWTPDTKFKAQLNSIARFGFGPDYFKEMKIVELVPSKQVKWICRKGAIEWIGTIISFELETGDQDSLLNSHPELKGQLEQERNGEEETLLIFHHDDWKTYSPMYAECNYT